MDILEFKNTTFLRSAAMLPIAMLGLLPKCSAQCALSRQVEAFSMRKESRLAAPARFGTANRISFGIEAGFDLAGQGTISVPAGTALSVVTAIMGPVDAKLACLGSVVVIRNPNAKQPAWLNARVPEFRLPKFTLGMADAALWMRVETLLDPKQKGFAGDIPADDPNNRVGSFDVRNSTVRALLCRLIASSRSGGIWIAGEAHWLAATSWRNVSGR